MTTVRRLTLRADVYQVTDANGQLSLLNGTKWGERMGVLTPRERDILGALATGEHPEAELLADDDPDSDLLDRLRAGGWLVVHHDLDDRPLWTVRPLGPHREPRPPRPVEPRLSRFAILRPAGDTFLLELPLCRAELEIHSAEVLAVLHALAGTGEPAGLPEDVLTELLTVLAWYGFVHESEEDGKPDLATEQWSPHELWFHARSRVGYHDLPFAATGWATERFPPLPARREPWPGTPVALPEPGQTLGPGLETVLAARRSIRSADAEAPLTLAQLGHFLHWSARAHESPAGEGIEAPRRASPSGGSLHSLEIYPVANTVRGLAAGMYRYDPVDHHLEPVPAPEFVVRQLLRRAGAAAGGDEPQVLLVVAARFGRVLWKYQSMGYALILKDLGALIQTMYLVATALHLAPCALGSGDAELFAQATGLDRLVEGSVGEFMLSTPAPR